MARLSLLSSTKSGISLIPATADIDRELLSGFISDVRQGNNYTLLKDSYVSYTLPEKSAVSLYRYDMDYEKRGIFQSRVPKYTITERRNQYAELILLLEDWFLNGDQFELKFSSLFKAGTNMKDVLSDFTKLVSNGDGEAGFVNNNRSAIYFAQNVAGKVKVETPAKIDAELKDLMGAVDLQQKDGIVADAAFNTLFLNLATRYNRRK